MLLLALLTLPARAQVATAVCLVKTERTGGKLAFVVRAADGARLEAIGFRPVACPATLDRAASGIGARCTRLRRLGPESRAIINELYGLSIESMCDAHDAWARTRSTS